MRMRGVHDCNRQHGAVPVLLAGAHLPQNVRVSFCVVNCDFYVVLALVLLYAGWT